jgi:hypothetical protein
MTKCMYVSCNDEAVSVCFNAPSESPLSVCFTHERELVDRYGFGSVQPRPIHEWPLDVKAAVKYLQTGEYA